MKTTFKQLLKFTTYTTVMALFFSCTPATGGYTTDTGTDTGTGTTTTATTGGSSTGSGTDTGTGTTTTATTGGSSTDSGTDTGTGTTTTATTGGSSTGSGTDTGTGTTITGTTGGSTTGSGTDTGTGTTITGTSGVSFSTTYNDPTLPENIGTDPFKGHTYRSTASYSNGSYDISYTFGNNGELTYTSTMTSGTTTSRNGQKYSYSYDATTKELSMKYTHILQKVPGSTEYRWYTYAEYINYLLNMTRSQFAEMSNTTTYYTDDQLKELIQNYCNSTKISFETTTIWKAELDASNNLVLRISYYKTEPSSLTNNSGHIVSYSSSQNSNGTYNSISFYLNILQTTTLMSNGGASLITKGVISTSRSSSGTSASKTFTITNISSNTISAAEYTSSSAGYTLVSDGITLQLGYTCSLGDDDNLLVTVTGSDDTTKDFLRTLLGDDTLTNPSITASSSTASSTYPFVE